MHASYNLDKCAMKRTQLSSFPTTCRTKKLQQHASKLQKAF